MFRHGSSGAALRLEAETGPVLLPGCRKIVRKWNEEIMRFQMMVRVKSRMACGNQPGAEAAWREFVAWMNRPDRKDFDKTG
jgi:predicted metal-binding protein